MRQRTSRIATVAALLMIGCGWMVPAHAGSMLTAPAGLAPGDQFRLVFVTDGTTQATSSAISSYDSFVQAQAGGATYDGVAVTWQAIGSTDSVDAIDHIGQTNTPVYLVDGTEVTTSTTTSGLWSGSLQHAINEDISGNVLSSAEVWTGTNGSGTKYIVSNPNALGNSHVGYGTTAGTDAAWVHTAFNGAANTGERNMYAISEVLTVAQAVPEPSSMLLLCTGGVMVAACGWTRRHRASGQGPVVVPAGNLR